MNNRPSASLKWEALFDNSSIGVWEWPDLSQERSIWSATMCAIFGLERVSKEVSTSRFFESVVPEDRDRIRQLLRRHQDEGEEFNCEYRIALPNGETRWVRASGQIHSEQDSRVRSMTGIVIDISDRKAHELRTNRTISLLNSAEKAAKLAAFKFNANSNELEFSEGGQALFGIEQEILSFNTFLSLVEENDRDQVAFMVQNEIIEKETVSFDFRLERKEDERIIKCYYNALSDQNADAASYYGIFRDITTSRKRRREIESLLDDLKKSNLQLEEFAYAASHDLQEPLRKIQTFGERLISKSEHLNEKDRSFIQRMHNAAERMQLLIKDLLEFSRIGRVDPPGEDIDLNALMQVLLEDMQVAINETNAEIEVQELPTIFGAKDQLYRVFLNLLSNSLKFRRKNVSPKIVVSSVVVKRSALIGKIDGFFPAFLNYYKISVEDNGIGFEDEYLEKIFTIFQRLHGKNAYSGTGIGLAIVKKIVEKHGGFITAHGEPENGAVFCMYLPRQ